MNELLFHVPVTMRDQTFIEFKDETHVELPRDKRDKNQINIDLDNIHSLNEVIPLIEIAY